MAESCVSLTVVEFTEILSTVSDWYTLGIFIGAESKDLKNIDLHHGSLGVMRCLIELYEYLETRGMIPTWEFLSSCLKRMNNTELAERIDTKFIVSPIRPQSSRNSREGTTDSTASDDTITTTTTTTDPVTSDGDNVKIDVPPEITSQFQSLFDRFTSLNLKIKKAFAKSGVNLSDVQHVIHCQCGLEPLVGEKTTFDDVFRRLEQNCSIFDSHVLTFLIRNFLSRNQILLRELKEYEKAVDTFKSSAKMGHLVRLIKRRRSVRNGGSRNLKLKVKELWNQFSMKRFEKAMKKLLGTLCDHVSQMSVDEGSLCIEWIIPDIDITNMIPCHSSEFTRIIGVLSLHIGDDVLYDHTTEKGGEVLDAAMLEATQLKNTEAIEFFLAMGCNPEIATYNGDNAVTTIVNIRESKKSSVDHVCIIGHNEHVEAIVDPNSKPAESRNMMEKINKQLHQENYTLRQEQTTLHSLPDQLQLSVKTKDVDFKELTEQMKDKATKYETDKFCLKEEMKEKEHLIKKIKQLQQQIDKLRQEQTTLHLQNDQLQLSVKAKDAEFEELTEQMKDKATKYETDKFCLKEEMKEKEHLIKKIKQLYQQIDKLRQEQTTLHLQNDQLQLSVKAKDAEFEELTEQMKEIDTGRQEQTTLHSLTDQLQLSVKAKDTEPSEELTEQMKDKVPTEDQFVDELLNEPNKDWYTLGFLLGLSEPDVKEIGLQYRPHGTDACLREVFRRLRCRDIKVTWEKIVDALFSSAMGNKELAKTILNKFCPDHQSEELIKITDEQLVDACSECSHDGAGFVLVTNIMESRIGKSLSINENDIRKVVAGSPRFTMNEDLKKPSKTKVRVNWQMQHGAREIDEEVQRERRIYNYASTVCRFGSNKRKLHYDKEGFVNIKDIIELIMSWQHDKLRPDLAEHIMVQEHIREYLKRAVKYRRLDELVIDEERELIRHVLTHPPEGDFETTPDQKLWRDLRTMLCDPPAPWSNARGIVYRDGYADVKDVLSHEKIQKYHRGTTEATLRRIVKYPPHGCQSNRFELKEGLPLMIRAKWGHTIPGVTVGYKMLPGNPLETLFVVFCIARRSWVVAKKEGIDLQFIRKNQIEAKYEAEPITEERAILEKYGHHKVTVVIDMKRALEDGLEFSVNSPEVITCQNDVILPKYFKRII